MANYPQSRNLRDAVDCLALIRKAPRTVPELVTLTDLSENNVRGCITALLDERLIVPTGPRDVAPSTRGIRATEYRWLELHEVTRHRCRVCGCDDPIAAAHPSNGAGVTSAAHSEPA